MKNRNIYRSTEYSNRYKYTPKGYFLLWNWWQMRVFLVVLNYEAQRYNTRYIGIYV